MSINAMLACLAALVQFQPCQQPALAAQTQDVAKADRLDVEIAEMQAEPAAYEPTLDAATWSGFHLGASAGLGRISSEQQLDRGNNHGYDEVDPQGFVASLTIGYNFVPAASLLVGVEGDIGLMAISDDDKPVFDGHSWKPAFGPLWGTLRARAGYFVSDALLVYATAGVAFMQTDNWTLGNNANESSWDATLRTGVAVGAGLEYALDARWKMKAELLYMDFGSHSGRTEDADPYTYEDSATILRLGVNYRF